MTFEAAFFGLGCFFDFPGWLLGFSVFVYYAFEPFVSFCFWFLGFSGFLLRGFCGMSAFSMLVYFPQASNLQMLQS